MAYRLGDYVTYGELFTTAHYGVYGFIVLRTSEEEEGGDHTFLRLELTGDPSPDLQNKHVCFEPEESGTIRYFDRAEHEDLRMHQYGATGTMTAQGWVRALPCDPDEYDARSRLGEPPPAVWKNHLYLEWFGPNGHMVIDLAGVLVEECTRECNEYDRSDEGDWHPLINWEPKPAADDCGRPVKRASGGGASGRNGSGEARVFSSNNYYATHAEPRRSEHARPERLKPAIGTGYGDEAESEFLKAGERLEACIRAKKETPLMRLLGGVRMLPHPDSLDSEGAEIALKNLLARMARLSVAVNVCEHCTPRDAYRILLEHILPGTRLFDGLVGTRWVQHITTNDHCEQCKRELEDQIPCASWN